MSDEEPFTRGEAVLIIILTLGLIGLIYLMMS
jgi:hypothetical protein